MTESERGSVFPIESATVGDPPQRPFHVAIIMDGNGRWAKARRRPREFGHRKGAMAVRGVVRAAPASGIDVLTLYAFSSDNWRRPAREVRALMALFRRYLRTETAELLSQGVRLQVVGRRDRLPETVVQTIEEAEAATAGQSRLLLRLAVDYSARSALLEAARRCAGAGALSPDDFTKALGEAIHGSVDGAPDVDLLIRTGGEQRLSDFLLWESAYAELVFLSTMWPDFTGADLTAAVAEFRRRDRRFGGVAAVV